MQDEDMRPDPALSLRPVRAADEPAVRALLTGVLAEYGMQPDLEGDDADLYDLEGAYSSRGGRFEVLADGAGEILGTVALRPSGKDACELRKMYLVPALRGRGWGKYLLRRAIELARADGYQRIELETASAMREAIGLYTRHGFRPRSGDGEGTRCDRRLVLELARRE